MMQSGMTPSQAVINDDSKNEYDGCSLCDLVNKDISDNENTKFSQTVMSTHTSDVDGNVLIINDMSISVDDIIQVLPTASHHGTVTIDGPIFYLFSKCYPMI